MQKYNYYKGISSLFKMIYKIDVQSLNCFYKISIVKKKNGVNAYNCKTRENSNFLKKGKIVISVKIRNFSKSRMMKRTSSLRSSREI